ncbi:MAG: hypothetical protein SVV03_01320, partial [Candidatus Nanohaloarchaea archaeon]|nr:hypothetical protein [Candidatus Nanohaloarchaea archaeon]
MMEKAVLLVLLAALLVGPAAADGHITFSEEAVTYAAQSSDTVSTTWKCDSSSGDCVSATVEICGESFDANLNDNNNYEIDFSVPGDVACTNGTHSPFKVEDSNGNLLHDGGSLKVNPKNMGRGGDYLYVTVDSTSDNPDTKSDYKLRNWVVSENPWGKNPEIHKGQIGIEEIDPFVANTHEYCTYWVEDGRISRDESLSSSVLANKTGDCDGSSDSGSGYPDQIFNLGFTSSNTEDLRPGNLRDDLNTWNPVHKNGGEYTPRGDLIRGELFSGKMQLSDSGDGTEFFVCDLKTDETTVRTDSDGTKLYSCDANLLQKDDWRINGDSGGREVFDWDRVYVCSDGNDNDGDGLKDLDDPECNNDWKHNSEAPPGGCPKAVVTVGDLLEEKAVWDKSGNTYTHPDYPGCSWGEVQENPSAPTRSPETFLCSRDTLANEGLG